MSVVEAIKKAGLSAVRTPFARMLFGASIGWYATNLAEKAYDKMVVVDQETTQPTE